MSAERVRLVSEDRGGGRQSCRVSCLGGGHHTPDAAGPAFDAERDPACLTAAVHLRGLGAGCHLTSTLWPAEMPGAMEGRRLDIPGRRAGRRRDRTESVYVSHRLALRAADLPGAGSQRATPGALQSGEWPLPLTDRHVTPICSLIHAPPARGPVPTEQPSEALGLALLRLLWTSAPE